MVKDPLSFFCYRENFVSSREKQEKNAGGNKAPPMEKNQQSARENQILALKIFRKTKLWTSNRRVIGKIEYPRQKFR